MNLRTLGLLALTFLSSIADAQSKTVVEPFQWSELQPTSKPSVRDGAAMAYDPERRRAVLFGGESDELRGDTWLWSGVNWHQVPKGRPWPPARRGHAMVYDSKRKCVVLFGGRDAKRRRNDTWEWDGKSWRNCKPKTRPASRDAFAMVFDVSLGKTVLFGGAGTSDRLGDMWAWDGENWARIKPATSPPARDGHALCYDAKRRRTVLFGGESTQGLLADTWEWDGVNWRSIKLQTPIEPRRDHAMAYEARRRMVVVAGGYARKPLGDAWEFNGERWTKLSFQKGPSARAGHDLVYDSRAAKLLLFGGLAAERSNETWTLKVESAFDAGQWNTAVGLGGGAGGRFGARGRGRNSRWVGKANAAAIEGGLNWLAAHQGAGGSFGDSVGDTGLALLAFLGDGSTMRSGPYKNYVKKAVKWLREQQSPDGRYGNDGNGDSVCDHAIATFAMGEAYGLSSYKLLKSGVQRALDYLESERDPKSVWRLDRGAKDHDIELTGWAILANETAEFFKLNVNRRAQEQCAAFLDSIADATATAVDARGKRERSEVLAAIGLFSRFMIGQAPKETPMMRLAADLVRAQPPKWDEEKNSVDPYYWFYGTYALYQYGGPHWRDWQKQLGPAIRDRQHRDRGKPDEYGSWDPVGVRGASRVRATALLTLTLEAYYRYTRLVR